jgi:molybdenum cofactor cytidylyltransferase
VTQTTILILAAGQSSRMRGADKLLQLIDGVPQLRRAALAAMATSCPVLVALPPDSPRSRAVQELPLAILSVPDAAEGIAASLRAGTRAAVLEHALLMLPADMPEIDTTDLQALLAVHQTLPNAILRGASAGAPGHPVLIPADLRPALHSLRGDTGARDLIRAHSDRLHLVPLPGQHATLDLDTPEDWQAWQAARAMPSSSNDDPG